MALYAFCREVDDIADEVKLADSEAESLARKALMHWSESLTRLASTSSRQNIVQEHPIAQALYDTVQEFSLPWNDLQLVIQGMRMDLNFSPYESWEDLFIYCDRVAGVVGRLSARIFGYAPENEIAVMLYATELGRALQLVNILRDGVEDRARSRIYIPRHYWPEAFSWTTFQQDILAHKNIDEKLWLKFYNAEMIEAFFQRIDTAFDAAKTTLPQAEKRRQRSGLVMGRVYFNLYQKMRHAYLRDPKEAQQQLATSNLRLGSRQKWICMLSTLIFGRGIGE